MPKDRKGNHSGNGKMHFGSVLRSDVPSGHKGKHRELVGQILEDLARLRVDAALRIPLERLNGEKIQNLRSALNREMHAQKITLATKSDDKYFYVWRVGRGRTADEPLAF